MQNTFPNDEAIYKKQIEHSPDVITVINRKLILITINRTISGQYTKEALIGNSLLNFIPRDIVPVIRQTIETCFEKKIQQMLEHNLNGGKRVISRLIPIESNGCVNEVMIVSTDITADKKCNKKLEKQLQQAQKMEALGSLAGGIAHDFNNILFPIIGISEMLMEDFPEGSEHYENAEEILKAGRRGSDLIKQILTFSRQTDQKIMPVRIQHILKETLKLVRSTIPANITIKQHIQTDCGMVKADQTHVHQITMNLITNAYHAVESTGGKILVTLKETIIEKKDLFIGAPMPGRYAMLSVSDTGKGIPSDIMDKIFEPYFTTKNTEKGTGLGLAVVYGIVKEYHGGLKLKSHIGKGTTFNVYLPLIDRTAGDTENENKEIPKGRNEQILLVDDEEIITELTQIMLERLGYRVVSYNSSIEALSAFKKKPAAFDLVITDTAMPEMPGDSLARELIEIRPTTPIIIFTGFSERITKEKAISMGIKGFLMKPVIKSQLAQIVREVLDGDV